MVPQTRIRIAPAPLLVSVLFMCSACQQGDLFPSGEFKIVPAEPDKKLSISFPGTSNGSVTIEIECEKYSRGIISLSTESELDSYEKVIIDELGGEKIN